jgi:hypothetical protein
MSRVGMLMYSRDLEGDNNPTDYLVRSRIELLLPVTTSRYQARQDLAAPNARTLAAKVIPSSSGGSMVDSPHRDDLSETREACPRCQRTRLFWMGLTA